MKKLCNDHCFNECGEAHQPLPAIPLRIMLHSTFTLPGAPLPQESHHQRFQSNPSQDGISKNVGREQYGSIQANLTRQNLTRHVVADNKQHLQQDEAPTEGKDGFMHEILTSEGDIFI